MLDLYAPPFETDDQRQRFQFLIENQDTALAEPPGGDRASLKLSAHDQQLILDAAASGVPVVVVMMGGSAFVTEGWRDRVSAILHLWYPGMEGGTATCPLQRRSMRDYCPSSHSSPITRTMGCCTANGTWTKAGIRSAILSGTG
jgi:hypothetical protein